MKMLFKWFLWAHCSWGLLCDNNHGSSRPVVNGHNNNNGSVIKGHPFPNITCFNMECHDEDDGFNPSCPVPNGETEFCDPCDNDHKGCNYELVPRTHCYSWVCGPPMMATAHRPPPTPQPTATSAPATAPKVGMPIELTLGIVVCSLWCWSCCCTRIGRRSVMRCWSSAGRATQTAWTRCFGRHRLLEEDLGVRYDGDNVELVVVGQGGIYNPPTAASPASDANDAGPQQPPPAAPTVTIDAGAAPLDAGPPLAAPTVTVNVGAGSPTVLY